MGFHAAMESKGWICYVNHWQQRRAFHFRVCQCMDVLLSGEAMEKDGP